MALVATSCAESTPGPDPSLTSVPATSSPASTTTAPDVNGPDVLLVVMNGLGVDVAPCYAADAVSAPTIESLCESGVVFDSAWSMPVSSSARAAMLTGQFGRRTGIGDLIQIGEDPLGGIDNTLPLAVDAAGLPHETALFGVWGAGGGPDKPNLVGWDYFGGLVGTDVTSYDEYTKHTQGRSYEISGYVTSDQISDTEDWLSHRTGVPWLVWLAPAAPLDPLHLPPSDLHEFDALTGTEQSIAANPRAYYDAAIQAVDTELGRLLDSLDPEVAAQTTIILVSDTGSSPAVSPEELDEAGDPIPHRLRGTLYRGGIHVPLVVAGPGVVDGGRRSDALVHTVDVFATVLELLGTSAGVTVPADVELDSVSLLPLIENAADRVRTRLYSERFGAERSLENDAATLRDDRFKVIRFADGTAEAYDLLADPSELDDLWSDPVGALDPQVDLLLAELDQLLPFPIIVTE